MKKILGILGVAVIAATIFFSANAVSGNSTDTDLASLVYINTANAEIMCPNPNGSGYIQAQGSVSSDCFNTQCVCNNGVCSEANWISFRTGCGNTNSQDPSANTNENCANISSTTGC